MLRACSSASPPLAPPHLCSVSSAATPCTTSLVWSTTRTRMAAPWSLYWSVRASQTSTASKSTTARMRWVGFAAVEVGLAMCVCPHVCSFCVGAATQHTAHTHTIWTEASEGTNHFLASLLQLSPSTCWLGVWTIHDCVYYFVIGALNMQWQEYWLELGSTFTFRLMRFIAGLLHPFPYPPSVPFPVCVWCWLLVGPSQGRLPHTGTGV